ncbi:6-phosphogluconolactonase [Aquabacterium lacunae]|uniref:6-phosphogluconolactonase n=1 Tax=Aquabacterium lacunae TaxID=2528630 RepID=A0A4Q9GXP7_9BURK|nr:6-phosphogluconolactonase [Aquabacterium lacunae]TBO30393.1 6-phosphogluconolactonase [Aquabacterium lacunae]
MNPTEPTRFGPAADHLTRHPHASEAALADALAHDIAQRLSAAIEARGQALLCVSGGKSPVPLFQALSGLPLPWAQVTVTLVDERCVPAEHADSNAALVRQHLLQGPAAAARFLAWVPPTHTPDHTRVQRPAWPQARAVYAEWVEALNTQLAPLWPADVVVLGMGLDGHTASIFGQGEGMADALSTPDLVVATRPPHAPHDRLTLSLAALQGARHRVLQISGAGKAQVLQQALQAPNKARPVGLVLQPGAANPSHTVSVWMGA